MKFFYQPTKSDLDNHANQLNPNNDAYWTSRGEEERPDDWENHWSDFSENEAVSVFEDWYSLILGWKLNVSMF